MIVQKLSDLSDYELSILLNSSVTEARRWRESARKNPDNTSVVMEWTTEEFRRDLARSEYSKARRVSRLVPRDTGLRFRRLQELLRGEFEFEARYPKAYEVLFPSFARSRDRAGLYLPSFGVYVLNNNPGGKVQFQDDWQAGDAYTYTNNRAKWHPWGKKVERSILSPDKDDLQGVLLAVLSREEYGERIRYRHWVGPLPDLFDDIQPSEAAYVRLTDLRLANSLRPGSLKRGLREALALLERPMTKDGILEWKLRLLGSRLEPPPKIDPALWGEATKEADIELEGLDEAPPEEPTEEAVSRTGNGTLPIPESSFAPVFAQDGLLGQQFGDEKTGVAAVSFSAAALLLFLDLDTPGFRNAPSPRVAEKVESISGIVRDLIGGLNRVTVRLDGLAANRAAGRQPEIEGDDYRALRNYRMGMNLREMAEWLGITPYSSKTGRGTRDWQTRVRQRLSNGKRLEDERYPRAAAIFVHRDNPHVRRKARRAYRRYLVVKGRSGDLFGWNGFGYYIRTGSAMTDRSLEITYAYVQLGSCIIRGIPPIP
jgi:hypothetical protein